jgi:NAD+ synthase (glutamine-hydrolysing)
MKATVAQLNPIVGDIEGNLSKIKDSLSLAKRDLSDLVIFPELFLVGYPPQDFLERAWFIEKVQRAIDELVRVSKTYPGLGILLGAPLFTERRIGKGLYNSAILIYEGRVLAKQHKSLLPTYDVFDEARYFDPAPDISVVSFKDEMLAISICEDAWNDPELWLKRSYPSDPIEILAKKGGTIFINISASPFYIEKEKLRFRIIQNHAKKHKSAFVFVNQVGANDELIFDGRSMCFDDQGLPIEVFPSFKECIKTVDMSTSGLKERYEPEQRIESVFKALVLGIQDYIKKCGFKKVVLGLSGGIDSAVVSCLAKEAVGSENVLGVSMPGPYSSKESLKHAKKLAKNLNIRFEVVSITKLYSSYLDSLKPHLKEKRPDITEENIQARIRGNILMALSNKFGYLVLSTGNKSELAVGYCTLYGDMSGGLAVISDLPKTMVYELADYLNKKKEIIPKEVIEKPPSAELRPNQQDQDTLPPYEILDQILYYYLDKGYSKEEILRLGFDPKIVKWVISKINYNEYKRRQAPLGLKVTSKAFGIGRRMPIAAKYD